MNKMSSGKALAIYVRQVSDVEYGLIWFVAS
jgi:hypothetical protein